MVTSAPYPGLLGNIGSDYRPSLSFSVTYLIGAELSCIASASQQLAYETSIERCANVMKTSTHLSNMIMLLLVLVLTKSHLPDLAPPHIALTSLYSTQRTSRHPPEPLPLCLT